MKFADWYSEMMLKLSSPEKCAACRRTIPAGFSAMNIHGLNCAGPFDYYLCNTCARLVHSHPECVVGEHDGSIDDDLLSDSMVRAGCSTPLQLLNLLDSESRH